MDVKPKYEAINVIKINDGKVPFRTKSIILKKAPDTSAT
jgi:hypothetical protein